MRIRFLLHNAFGRGGGVLSVVRELAAELASRHDVEVVSVLRTRDLPVHPLPEGVEVRALYDARLDSSGAARGGVRPLMRRATETCPSLLVPREDPRHDRHSLHTDLLLARYIRSVRDGALVGMQPAISMAIARFGRGSVVRVGQEHRPFVSRPERMQAAMLRTYPRLDAFATLTERDAQSYRPAFGGRVPVVVMPNGLTPYDGEPADYRSRTVVAAGRLLPDKGFDRLIDAWSPVAEQHPDWRLRIFGRGPERSALRRRIDSLGLGDSVRLAGYRPDVRPALARGSVFVLSSRTEGYPMALLEAMSCGLAVVSFDCPTGPREIITDGVDGVLVPEGDVEALADALGGVIGDPELRRRLGAAAVGSAHQRAEPRTAALWEELLADRLRTKR